MITQAFLVPKLRLGTPFREAPLRQQEAELPRPALPSRAWERGLLALALAIFLLSLPGCAGWKNYLQLPKPGPSREERAAEAVKSFEEHRDTAQLEAALDRWNQGDAARAEAMLTVIVNRRPDHVEARMRLGEMLWSRGDAAAAEPHF